MSTSTPDPRPSRKRKRGPYSYSKCSNCRKDKKKCEPIERPADQPCHRCQEKGVECPRQNTVLARKDSGKKDISPASSLSENSSAITLDLDDPAIQCLHLFNWYKMIPASAPIHGNFRQAVLDVFSNTMTNTLGSDLKGRALLALVVGFIDSDFEPSDMLCQFESESYYTVRLELSRRLWDTGHTFHSIEELRTLISIYDPSVDDDVGTVLFLQILRQYFCFLKRFWDINRQLWKIRHAELANQVPRLRRYIQAQTWFPLEIMPSWVIDQILDEEPAYCTSLDADGNTPLHHVLWVSTLAPAKNPGQAVEKLLDKGLGVNIKNEAGQTALHILCQRKPYGLHSVSCLKLLIGHAEIDINAQNREGMTALHLLCGVYIGQKVGIDMLELLLEHQDIDVGIRDEEGRLAADRLPETTAADLLGEYPFLWPLFPSSSVADRPRAATVVRYS